MTYWFLHPQKSTSSLWWQLACVITGKESLNRVLTTGDSGGGNCWPQPNEPDCTINFKKKQEILVGRVTRLQIVVDGCQLRFHRKSIDTLKGNYTSVESYQFQNHRTKVDRAINSLLEKRKVIKFWTGTVITNQEHFKYILPSIFTDKSFPFRVQTCNSALIYCTNSISTVNMTTNCWQYNDKFFHHLQRTKCNFFLKYF